MHDVLGEPVAPPVTKGFLPDFCRPSVMISVVLATQLLAVSLTLASQCRLGSFWGRLGPLSLLVLIISLLAIGGLCVLRPILARANDRTGALLAWTLLVAVAGLTTWAGFALMPPPLHEQLFPHEGLFAVLLRSLGISAILGGMLLRYLYLHHQWQLQVEAEAEARFQKLQARIRPHFQIGIA